MRPSCDVVGHERRVVAEAARRRAARPPACPVQRPSNDVLARRRRVDVRRARRRTRSALPAGASRSSLVEVLLVGGVLAGVARRAHAGRAAERRGLDARVVGDRRPRRSPRAAARALQRVLGERRRPSRAAARRRRAAARLVRRQQRARTRAPCARCGSRGRASRATPAAIARPAAARSSSMPARGEREQLVEVRARQRRALGGRLDLDEPAVAGHDDVRVDLGASSPRGSRGRAAARRRRSRTRPRRPCPVSGERSSAPLGDEPRAARARARRRRR